MHFTSFGASREVTGSRHILDVNGKRILLDCGLFQGHREDEWEKNKNFGFDPKDLDAVIISHAHIDHSGNLPNLVKQGYKGPIYCTEATVDLLEFMLRDSAMIQEKEVEYLNEKRLKANEEPLEPLYTMDDAEKVFPLVRGVSIGECLNLFETSDIRVCFQEAGHILGSAITILTVDDQEDGKRKTLAFTGDLGRKNMPLIKDPYQVSKADILIMESTYGNRLHESLIEAEDKLAEVVQKTAARGGKILIPAFSLGRTQEIVYSLHKLMDEGRLPPLPIIVDSPLSVNLTEVFRMNMSELDEDTQKDFLSKHEDPFEFKQIRYITSVEDSKALNNHNGPCIIISSSGMCEHGRIVHHLNNSIEDHRNTLIIVGFQAQNTLGRKLVEGQKEVNIFGKPHAVRMEIVVMNAYSAHADRSDLIEYATRVKHLQKLILVHGEETSALDLKVAMEANSIPEVIVPTRGETVTL